MSKSTSRGFTLVELLVVIAIIGVLVALLLPAVQAARESARKMQCATQLRELGQAALTFEGSKKRFPGWQEIVARDAGTPIASAGTDTKNKPATWAVLLLPYLDQNAIYDSWNDQAVAGNDSSLSQFLPIYSCPSRQTTFRQGPLTSYVANAGYSTAPGASVIPKDTTAATSTYWNAFNKNNGVFLDRIPFVASGAPLGSGVPKRLNEVTTTDIDDGLSNTLLFAENLLGGRWTASNPNGYGYQQQCETTFQWFYSTEGNVAPCDFPGGAAGAFNPLWKINSKAPGTSRPYADVNAALAAFTLAEWQHAARPSAWHSGGVNVVFADKHTIFLKEGIDYDVYQQLMTPYGKKSGMPCGKYVLKSEDFGG